MYRVAPVPRVLSAGGLESSFLKFFALLCAGLADLSSGLSIPGISAARRLRHIVFLIRSNYLLHQVVAHHIFFPELHDPDALDLAAYFERLDQSRPFPRRQIDLRGVAGD